MQIDFKRILFILIGFILAQFLIQSFLVMIGISGISFLIIYYLLFSFVVVLLNYPPGYRISSFKSPDFYRNVAILFLIFLLLSLLGF